MTPHLVFRPEARAEVREARERYEAQSPGLGLEFARAVEAVLATITAPLRSIRSWRAPLGARSCGASRISSSTRLRPTRSS